jgi:hypothetical protein
MVKEFFVSEKIVAYCKSLLKLALSAPSLFKDNKQSCLSSNCFATLNLLDFPHADIFYNYIDTLRIKCEEFVGQNLEYVYLHLVDYSNGGTMGEHKHSHNEDYSFILYLNTCTDGQTVLILRQPYEVLPSANKVLLFSSYIPHMSEYSDSKKILVGGLKLKQKEI